MNEPLDVPVTFERTSLPCNTAARSNGELNYGGACNWCGCDRYVGEGLTCERDSCGHSWDVHA